MSRPNPLAKKSRSTGAIQTEHGKLPSITPPKKAKAVKAPKSPKPPKPPKSPKAPKSPKVPKAPKPPKAPKSPKAPKPPKEPKNFNFPILSPRVATPNKLEALESDGRRASLPLAQLRDDEKEFFEVVEGGEAGAVDKFIQGHSGLNINCVDYMGQGALYIAIQKEHTEVVARLLRHPEIEPRDAALHAVRTGNTDLTTAVLDALGPGREKAGCTDSPDFSADMTPLKLACHLGDYKMVRLLFERNHHVEKPHLYNCLCAECKNVMRDAGSSVSLIRLNAYRAICNPTYICQVTNDPILYCFILHYELKQCAQIDKEFKSEYKDLRSEVKNFAVSLLNQCRNTSEIEILLRLPWGYDGRVDSEFPRLQSAVEYKQKRFVAHSMVQQVLSTQWLGEFRSWPRYTMSLKTAHVLMRAVLLPFFCFVLLFSSPKFKITRKHRAPVSRFLLCLASYLLFLFAVFCVNVFDQRHYEIGPPNSGMEFVVALFVVGFIWHSLTQCWTVGMRRFLSVPWNWYDMVMEIVFLLTFAYWLISKEDLKTEIDLKKTPLARKFWKSTDASLLHEGFFAIATVLSFGKLAYFCLQSSRLGPLQVSVGKMGVQIASFLLLCFLINTSFAIPLTRMYAYYDGMSQTDASGSTATQLSSFSTFPNSFLTLFWGMFGMSPVESADVIIENLTDDKKNPVINTHGFTQGVGRALFAVYELLMIIALVNTLIAILSNTFQKVVDNSDVEFKFSRTKLWIHFFDERSLLPSPFNLLPTPGLIETCANHLKVMANKVPGTKAKFSIHRCCYIEYEQDIGVDIAAYELLMSSIIQRYFRAKEHQEEEA